jgi:predicted naringenin-chalcone synthase
MSRIISIGTSVPKYGIQQNKILEFMTAAYADDMASRKLRVLFNYSGIDTRYSALPDFNPEIQEHILFNGEPVAPDVAARSEIFKLYAVNLAAEAIQNAAGKLKTTLHDLKVTHLIAVSCTGIFAPGLDIALVEKLNLPDDIFHTSLNFIGCNAAFPALKLGDFIATTNDDACILIVCTELCTLHFQAKSNHDHLLSNTIFGDGAAAAIILSDKSANDHHRGGLFMNGFYSLLLKGGKELMTWNITPVGFEMVLDARVPDFIGAEIDEVMVRACNKLNMDPSSIDKWAIHPGGKKILDTIRKKLNLDESVLQNSYNVLNHYGNMSSPTILFVLNEIMEDVHHPGEIILSIGFGPGLSIETAKLIHAE